VGHGLRALKTAQRGNDWYFELVTASRTAIAAFGAGDLRLAAALADASVRKAGECREASCRALGHVIHAALAAVRGDAGAAARHAAASASHGRRSGHAAVAYHAIPLQLYLAVQSGQEDDVPAVLASAWGELPRSATGPFLELADRRLRPSIPPPANVRPPRLRRTWLGAGIFVAECVAALDRDDRAWVEAALPLLEELTDEGLQFTVSYPAAVTRIQGDALAACGHSEEAVVAYRRATDLCRRQEAYGELALALLGQAATEATMPGSSVDHVRQLAAEVTGLAHRLDLPAVERSAALLATNLDRADNVTRRQGQWRVILLTDIVGSTRVSFELGDRAYYQLVQQHHEIVRRCLEEWRGNEFSETGDGLFAWFTSTVDAVHCAIAIQRELSIRRARSAGLDVRIVLAGGEPLFSDGRPFGLVLNRAARLLGTAGGGQVLLDEATTAEAAARFPIRVIGPLELRDLGLHSPGLLDV
jgi:class 3 adenylate cyclase